MRQRSLPGMVQMGFEQESVQLPIDSLVFLHQVSSSVRKSVKYAKIAASIREVGIIEPPIVAHDQTKSGKHLLLDGRLRVDILKVFGETEVTCLIAKDDEAFTYNRYVNRLATVQEYKMLLKAIDRGVPEDRLARTLNISVSTVKGKMRALDGICPEVVDIFKDRHVPEGTFWELKKMLPLRQIEAATIMVAMNKFSATHAKTLVGATPSSQLVEKYRKRPVREISPEQKLIMETEAARLDREVKVIEESYGVDYLDLVLARGYLGKLLSNAGVLRHLAKRHPDILSEFQKLIEAKQSVA